MNRLCVFCGSRDGTESHFVEVAEHLARLLARRGIGVVYGGGNDGLMGRVANAALAEGGEVIGVIPKELVDREHAHEGLSELHIVSSMHERKALMSSLADGFVALPGGMGTLEEIAEMFTWAQLGIHAKPCALLNADGYWDPLIAMLDRMTSRGFLRPLHRSISLAAPTAEALLDVFDGWEAPPVPRWLDLEQA